MLDVRGERYRFLVLLNGSVQQNVVAKCYSGAETVSN